MRRRGFELLAAAATLLIAAASPLFAEEPLPFPAADAGGEAGKIYQLTNVPGSPAGGKYDWYALYYHDGDTTIQNYGNPGAGNKLVLRRMNTAGRVDGTGRSASTVIYFALDLDTGTLSPVTPEGKDNAGYVKGPWLYAMERDTVRQSYFKLVRYDLMHGNQRQELGNYPALASDLAHRMDGNLTVSDDQRYLIWIEDGGSAGRIFHLKNLANPSPADKGTAIDISRLTDNKNGVNVEHFQFLKGARADWFTCIDQSKKATTGLGRVGIGRADAAHPACTPLKPGADASLNRYNYFHPFVDLAGNLWGDASRWGPADTIVFYGYVRFDQWRDDGTLEHDTWFAADGTPFQVHANFTMNPAWFLGDGATVLGKPLTGKSSGGLDAIYLLHMSAGKTGSAVLAKRATGVDLIDGTLQPNVHLAYLMRRWGAVWSEWRTLVPQQPAAGNVFFAPLPAGAIR